MIFLSVSAEHIDVSLPQGVVDYIKDTKSATLRESRRLAYGLLYRTLYSLYPGVEAEVKRDDEGKPEIHLADGRRIFVSISHTQKIAAVAISDECEIGVDVEPTVDPERAERLQRRFLCNIPSKKESDDYIDISLLRAVVDDKISLTKCDGDLSVTDRWVLCESALKCDGGGFKSYAGVADIIAKQHSLIYRVSYESVSYSLAISVCDKGKSTCVRCGFPEE